MNRETTEAWAELAEFESCEPSALAFRALVALLDPVVTGAAIRPGIHFNMLGADGPGKAEAEPAAVARAELFCDEWEQASHGGELAAAVEAGAISRADVTELGRVLLGEAEGRRGDDEITIFDSTGLAIQDLAVAIAALERADELDLPRFEL